MRSVSADQIGHAGEMTTESVINLERRDDGVAIITLTNGKVNPLSTAVLEGLHAIADELAVIFVVRDRPANDGVLPRCARSQLTKSVMLER